MSGSRVSLQRQPTIGPGDALGEALAHLLGACDLRDFAARAGGYLHARGLHDVQLGWRNDGGRVHPAGDAPWTDEDADMALAAVDGPGIAEDPARRRAAVRVHRDDDGEALASVFDGAPGTRPDLDEALAVLAPLARAVCDRHRLQRSLDQSSASGQLQSALFTIADMASSDMDLGDMLRELHAIVGRFMYAENFYIALYDEGSDLLRFIYMVDTVDPLLRDADELIPMPEMERGLTWYLVRDRKPLRGSMPEIRTQISGPMRDIGLDSYDWLGVPILVGDQVRGVLVVQSYVERARYTPADQALLGYVGSHILTAVDRKLAQEQLERRVDERTHALQLEVQERQRAVRVQEALFRIAELSHTATNLEQFYRAVHGIVGEFLDARNFYIATLSDDGQQLDFPYFVDQFSARVESRRKGNGLSEHVIAEGRPLLLDASDATAMAELAHLLAGGDGQWNGPRFDYWLGVPLLLADRAVGVLAVQSYTPGAGYTARDRELLTFISYQIANGLERQRAAAALKHAYADLEQRVEARTRELSEQIRVRERIEQALKQQVLHDPLTGLPNRAYLRDQIVRALAQRDRDPGHGFAVLFMDLDRFKVINDSVGHLVGDMLLKEVALRFSHCVRGGSDMVARLGGDEFAILMEVVNPEAPLRMAQRVIEALREPVRVDGKELFTGVSVGIALGSAHYTTPEDLLRDADIAMYRAKAGGRHRFEVFDETLHRQALQLLETEGDLRRGARRGEFLPYFQPIVRLVDGAVAGYEALMRWRHPQRGMLAPGAFLPVAEAIGIMEALDWQVFEAALRAIPRLLGPGQYVNLNLSPRHFRAADLDARFLACIDAHGVDPAQVRIEITEGALLENAEQIGAVFDRLNARGVQVALDDFGTGYSSLSYLHRFNMHTLKVDRSFVGDLDPGEERNSTAVVRAILALSRAQGMEVVAEGIETEEQRAALIALGCELGQGYLFARPESLETIVAARPTHSA